VKTLANALLPIVRMMRVSLNTARHAIDRLETRLHRISTFEDTELYCVHCGGDHVSEQKLRAGVFRAWWQTCHQCRITVNPLYADEPILDRRQKAWESPWDKLLAQLGEPIDPIRTTSKRVPVVDLSDFRNRRFSA